jgi:8-oxo-dGTP pyrophosphatase MutT (NUDIX family)
MAPRDTAGGIVLGPDGRMVLVHQGSNVWSFPKGGIEEGEDVLAAARREIHEETGLSGLTVLKKLGSYKRYRIAKGGVGEDTSIPESTRTIFLFNTTQTILTPQDGEVLEARWCSVAEALGMLTHPKDKAFLSSVADIIQSAV